MVCAKGTTTLHRTLHLPVPKIPENRNKQEQRVKLAVVGMPGARPSDPHNISARGGGRLAGQRAANPADRAAFNSYQYSVGGAADSGVLRTMATHLQQPTRPCSQ